MKRIALNAAVFVGIGLVLETHFIVLLSCMLGYFLPFLITRKMKKENQ